ncbi:MAG: TetR/AcrR family transcriptional regulator [Clostridiales bacterium]|nr:TetR/AcrR family transcriptional regulator [Clostridiales bacterium]
MPKGIMLTPEQQTQRREEIVAIALRLIDENGFQKTSMREIAEMANMGKSSLYDFFKTKDEIIVYAVEQEIISAAQEIQKIASDGSSSPEQRLRKIMFRHHEHTRQNQNSLMWLNAEITHLNEEYQKRLHTVRHAYQDIVQSVIEDGITSGIFRKTDTVLTARLLINSTLSIIFTSRPSSDLETMLEETIRIFLRGIMA